MADSDTLPFLPRVQARPKRPALPADTGEPEETVEPGNTFAVARGVRAIPTLKFLRHNGKLLFAMPYAYHPIVWGESARLVLLEYPGFFTVILAGKNLEGLEARLCDYRVTWIRQCDDAQAALLPAAVTRIERMKRYPSREMDGSGKP